MNEARPSTAQEALIAEVLGDVLKLSKQVTELPDRIEYAAEAVQTQVKENLAAVARENERKLAVDLLRRRKQQQAALDMEIAQKVKPMVLALEEAVFIIKSEREHWKKKLVAWGIILWGSSGIIGLGGYAGWYWLSK